MSSPLSVPEGWEVQEGEQPGLLYYGEGKLLTRINVPDKYRGDKVGSRLLKTILAQADIEKITMFLEIMPSGPLGYEELEAWYFRNGFKKWNGIYRRKPMSWHNWSEDTQQVIADNFRRLLNQNGFTGEFSNRAILMTYEEWPEEPCNKEEWEMFASECAENDLQLLGGKNER